MAESATLASSETRGVAWIEAALPIALALIAAGVALRGAFPNTVVHPDASRHALNGALIHDLVTTGNLDQPLDFAKQYYIRLPAVSLPYHPPLFPAVEAVFYALFGVQLYTARLAVAAAVAAATILMYLLVRHTHRSLVLAAAATLTFNALPVSQSLAADVMLEYPSLALALAALYLLSDGAASMRPRHWLAFALFAGAAVWTKQHAVFVGLVPFALVALRGEWSTLRRPWIWLASLLFAAEVFALTKLSTLAAGGAGVADQVSPTNEVVEILWHNLCFYAWVLPRQMTLAGAVWVAAGFLGLFATRWMTGDRRNDLDLVNVACLFALLLAVGQYDGRYLFYGMPALVTLGYVFFLGIARLVRLEVPGKALALAFATVLAALPAVREQTPTFIAGPYELAKLSRERGAKRILCLGWSDGHFIYAMRCLDPALDTVVVRGDKLSDGELDAATLLDAVRDYGIDHLVLERSDHSKVPGSLWESTPAEWELLEERPLVVRPYRSAHGLLRIYAVREPVEPSKTTLDIPVRKIRGTISAPVAGGQ